MKVVYRAEHIVDANLMKNLLEQAGYLAFVRGEHLTGSLGETPALEFVDVAVADSDEGGARKVVEEFEASRARDQKEGAGETRWDNLNEGLGDWAG
ncbi:MAG: DUF2007 domain-containing protein [Pseudomonadota bacterium]